MTRLTFLMLMVSALSAAAGQILFKVGAREAIHWTHFINLAILSGLLLYGLATVLWIYALSFVALVNVYAFTALTFVLVYIGGWVILGEKISLGGGVGISFVLIGLYLITKYNV